MRLSKRSALSICGSRLSRSVRRQMLLQLDHHTLAESPLVGLYAAAAASLPACCACRSISTTTYGVRNSFLTFL